MKIQKAIKKGFVKGQDGFWRKRILQKQKDGVYRWTWQKYTLKSCERCNEDFIASHSTLIYCSSSCSSLGNQATKGRTFNRPHQETIKHNSGYILRWIDKKKYMLEHRYIMEQQLGRPLKTHEHIHHINGNRSDNRVENLVLLTKSHHNSIHKREEVKSFKRDKSGKFTM